MKTCTLIDIQARIYRLERQNRILITILCAIVGVASIAAAKHADSIITATQVRAQRLTLIDNRGNALVDTQGVNGGEIRAYLPNTVVQQFLVFVRRKRLDLDFAPALWTEVTRKTFQK